jgi:hypothetical protein
VSGDRFEPLRLDAHHIGEEISPYEIDNRFVETRFKFPNGLNVLRRRDLPIWPTPVSQCPRAFSGRLAAPVGAVGLTSGDRVRAVVEPALGH